MSTDADAAYWTDYFKAFPQARITSGRADADVTLAKLTSRPAPGLPLDLSGHVALRRVTIAVADKRVVALPLENVNGTAAFTGAGVSFQAALFLAGQPLQAAGTVFDFAHAQIAVMVQSDRLDPARLSRGLTFLKLPAGVQIAPGAVTAQFTGAAVSPTITVSGSLPSVTYAGNRATSVTAQAIYAGKVLSIPSAQFRLNGTGQAALRGTVDLTRTRPVVLLAGTLRGVDLAALRLPAKGGVKNLNLGGVADAQFLADNQGRPPSVVANVSIANARVRRTTLRSVSGRVAWTQGQAVTLTQAILRDTLGAAAVSGTLPAGGTGQWNLAVQTAGLNLAGLLKPYTKMAVGGRADFRGKILGPAQVPQAVGLVRLAEPRFGRYSADLIGGQVAASLSAVHLTDVTLSRFPTQARIDGTVTGLAAPNPRLALQVALSEGDVQDFLHLAEQASAAPKSALTASLPNLTGTADGNFQVTGRLNSPAVNGHARVMDATVGGYRLDKASADLHYSAGALFVTNALIKSGTATLTAHGQRTDRGILQADFALAGLNLDRLHHFLNPYADVDGTVSLTGKVGGTAQAPHVAVSALAVPNLVVNGQVFQPLSLAGRYDDGIVTQTGAPWKFIVSVPREYSADAASQVEYRVDALRLVLPTPSHPNRLRALTLSAAIPVTAPEQLPHLFATVRGLRWSRTPAGQAFLARLAALPQPISGTFALPKIQVAGPLNALSAQADVHADNLILGETHIGSMTVNASYDNGAKPSGHLAASAQNLLASGVPINSGVRRTSPMEIALSPFIKFGRPVNARFLNASGTANLDGEHRGFNLDASNIPAGAI